jgi:FKBP-type peptidyl-prolyl cis-trans isomerase FkpA
MKQKIFTFLLIAAAGLTACKKDKVYPDIKQYDDLQIQNYLNANNLTGFTKAENDTTGIYYKIINPGTGKALDYSDQVSIVYTMKSFDGKYVSSDTITNHYVNVLGHLTAGSATATAVPPLPKGLELAVHDILKYKGGSMRLMIPSRLAYGKSGFTISSLGKNISFAGNQSIDFYVHIINDQAAYDDLAIRNYMKAKGLSGYTKTASGIWYKTITPGTGAVGSIKEFSNVTSSYTGTLLNDLQFDTNTSYVTTPYSSIPGMKEILLNHAVQGTVLSIVIPSGLAYGESERSGLVFIPSNSVLRFEWTVTTVTQP